VVRRLARRERQAPRKSLRDETGGPAPLGQDAQGGRRKKTTAPGTLSQTIDRWLQAAPTGDSHWKAVATDLKLLTGHLRHRQLRTEHALALVARWREKYSRNTIYNRAKLLRTLLRACEQDGAPRITIPRQPSPTHRKRIALEEEAAKLLAVANPAMRLFLMLTSVLGMRFSEACSIKPADWNPEKHLLTWRRKGRDEHQLPITPEIEQLFAIAPETTDPDEGYISRLLGTHKGGHVKWRIRHAWNRMLKRAGVSKDLTPHDLRRTAATTLYELTQDIFTVQALLGHAKIETTAKYIQHATTGKMRPLLAQLWHPTPKVVQ
jgi:integrase